MGLILDYNSPFRFCAIHLQFALFFFDEKIVNANHLESINFPTVTRTHVSDSQSRVKMTLLWVFL